MLHSVCQSIEWASLDAQADLIFLSGNLVAKKQMECLQMKRIGINISRWTEALQMNLESKQSVRDTECICVEKKWIEKIFTL